MFITSFLLTILGELQSDFYKHLTEFYQISLKNSTNFSPQLMVCLEKLHTKLREFFSSAMKDVFQTLFLSSFSWKKKAFSLFFFQTLTLYIFSSYFNSYF